MSRLSFKEGLQWVTFLGITVLYGLYFLQVVPPSEPDVTAAQIVRFGWYTGFLIVVHIVGASILAARSRAADLENDERDRLIQARSQSAASYVLGVGILGSMAAAVFIDGNFAVLHALLATLVLAQMLESALQIFYYRRGF